VSAAGLVLGPFGFSISVVEYARKNGADLGSLQVIDPLAENKTEGVRDQMKLALDDKDTGIRHTEFVSRRKIVPAGKRHDQSSGRLLPVRQNPAVNTFIKPR